MTHTTQQEWVESRVRELIEDTDGYYNAYTGRYVAQEDEKGGLIYDLTNNFTDALIQAQQQRTDEIVEIIKSHKKIYLDTYSDRKRDMTTAHNLVLQEIITNIKQGA